MLLTDDPFHLRQFVSIQDKMRGIIASEYVLFSAAFLLDTRMYVLLFRFASLSNDNGKCRFG